MSIIPTGPMGRSTSMKEMSELHNPEEMRKMSESGAHTGLRERLWGLKARMAPGVTFEEYAFWAKVEREMEEEEHKRYLAATKNQSFLGGIKAYFSPGGVNLAGAANDVHDSTQNEKAADVAAGTDSTDSVELSPVAPTHDYDAELTRT